MTDPRRYVYEIDGDDRLVHVNEDWLAFARENGAEKLTLDSVISHRLWEFVADQRTAHIYTILLSKVRTEGVSIRIPFRCDSPNCRRFMELEMSPAPAFGVRFEGRLLRAEPRVPSPGPILPTGRAGECIIICSWCKKISLSSSKWVEAEEAVRALNLFAWAEMPKLSHGMCPQCAASFGEDIEAAATSS